MANARDMTSGQDDEMNAAQVEFSLNPNFIAPMTKHVLEVPDDILDEVEKFSAAWLDRRQIAVKTMIEAGQRMTTEGAADPSNAIKEIADWQAHSMARLAQDAKDYSELMAHCAGALFTFENAPTVAKVENTNTAKKKGK
ncbi:hypothetical protein [Aliiroseovarius sediminis]|uniref:hypothetical protein n=1 Tax=Aliiroseovarius sediminis TaxID=2925839 RepID=UPI001F56DD8C|nr:hypothetical protein [Aliiroseovarius sediminis]MCI2393898.1 hypothetical protein [Aliiroseovarius sediminis]